MIDYTKDLKCYKNAALAIKKHLKRIWEHLEERVEYLNFILLRSDAKKFDSEDKEGIVLGRAVLSSVRAILREDPTSDRLGFYVDNKFADLFEDYLLTVKALSEIKDDAFQNSDKLLDAIFTLIAGVRSEVKAVDGYLNFLDAPTIPDDAIPVKDDRIAITLESLEGLIQTKRSESKGLSAILLMRRIGGISLLSAISSLFGIIALVVSEIITLAARVAELSYLKNISKDEYNAAVNSLESMVLGNPFWGFIYTALGVILPITAIISVIYCIVSNVIFKKLRRKEPLCAEMKYALAWLYTDMARNPFGYNPEKHRLLMIEASEEGLPDAYLRLGVLYEKGQIAKLSEKERLINAMRCYKQAFPKPTAVKKYNNAKKLAERITND